MHKMMLSVFFQDSGTQVGAAFFALRIRSIPQSAQNGMAGPPRAYQDCSTCLDETKFSQAERSLVLPGWLVGLFGGYRGRWWWGLLPPVVL